MIFVQKDIVWRSDVSLKLVLLKLEILEVLSDAQRDLLNNLKISRRGHVDALRRWQQRSLVIGDRLLEQHAVGHLMRSAAS